MLLKIGCALLAGSCCKARELSSMSMSYNLIIVIIKICFNNKFYIVYNNNILYMYMATREECCASRYSLSVFFQRCLMLLLHSKSPS